VALTFADLVIVAVLVALGCVVTYVSMQRKLRRIVVELQQSSRQQLDALTQTLKAVEERIAELTRPKEPPQRLLRQKKRLLQSKRCQRKSLRKCWS